MCAAGCDLTDPSLRRIVAHAQLDRSGRCCALQRASAALSPRFSFRCTVVLINHPAETTACRLTGRAKAAPARSGYYRPLVVAVRVTCGMSAPSGWAPPWRLFQAAYVFVPALLAFVHAMPGPCRLGSAGKTWLSAMHLCRVCLGARGMSLFSTGLLAPHNQQ